MFRLTKGIAISPGYEDKQLTVKSLIRKEKPKKRLLSVEKWPAQLFGFCL